MLLQSIDYRLFQVVGLLEKLAAGNQSHSSD